MRSLALTALCALIYATGLTSQGLVNWQESTRALVAREMQRSGDFLAPTMRGEAYLAKPPMLYWAQIALATAMGEEVGEWHLRAVVAIIGWLGVLATYFVARRMFRDGLAPPDQPDGERAAWWSAVGLAVSILYVRSSRTGEIDILLPLFTVLTIGAVHAAWVHAARTGRTHLGAVLMAMVCAIAAVWSKGPPALACIASAMLVGPMLFVAESSSVPVRRRLVGAAAGMAAVMGAVFAFNPVAGGDVPGIALLMLVGGVAGWCIATLTSSRAFRAWLGILARTHPVAVLGAPVVVLWLWGRYLERAFGADVVESIAAREVENNLNLFVPGAIEKNVGFLLYGSAPIILAVLAAIGHLMRERVRLPRSVCLLLAWLIGGFIVFSIAGKGVARYLTPLWPACAMLGGWWIAGVMRRMRSDGNRRRIAVAMAIVALGFAGTQAWWYGFGRGAYNADDSIRALAMELKRTDAANVATWEFDDPALDLYLDQRVPIFGRKRGEDASALRAFIEAHGPVMLLVRESSPAVLERYGDAMRDFADAGLRAAEVGVEAVHVRPPGDVRVRVYEVSRAD